MTHASLSTKDYRSLCTLLGEERVSVREEDRLHYTHDCMSRSLIQLRHGQPLYWPQAIVWPESTQEVAKIVTWARRRKIPLVAFGGGSGVCGGTLPIHGGVTVDLKRMDAIEEIHPKKRQVLVQAGINCLTLEEHLQEKGLTLGHFPSSVMLATLGGSVAARGAGQLSSKYGTIDDMVDAVEVVLPSGEVLPLGAKQIPKLPGIPPVPLFVGSEGTLGIVTRCRLRLHRRPEAERYRAVSFVHLPQALTSIRRIMQAGLRPSVLRLYDRLDSLILQWGFERHLSDGKAGHLMERAKRSIQGSLIEPITEALGRLKGQALNRVLASPRWLDYLLQRIPVSSILVLGFDGDPDIIAAEEDEALRICQQVLCRDEGPGMGHHWHQHRYSVSYKLPEMFRQGNFVDTIEVASTWDRLEGLYEKVRNAITRHCLVMAHFSHAYPEGCSIYFTIVGRETSPKKELKVYDCVWHDAMEACLQAGGTISHHHGVGVLKTKNLSRELGGLMGLFREVKATLDPDGIMNPGKMSL